MDALEQLKAILAQSGKASPEAEQQLQQILSTKPEPSTDPRPERTLAEILAEPRETPTAAPAVSLVEQLQRRAEQAPPPPVTIMPSDHANFGGPERFGRAFAGIEYAGQRKPRQKKPLLWEQDAEKKEKVETLSLQLLKEMGDDYQPHPRSSVADAHFRAGVQETFELERILKIPRRPSGFDLVDEQTEKYRRPEGTMRLWPIQSFALIEAEGAGGLLAPIGVGHGKTLISLLVGSAMRAKKIVLLVPPQLRTQLLEQDIPYLNAHWHLPLDRLRVIAYSELSHARSAEILEEIKPDLIVADECHNLRHRTAARTKRFLRYMKEHPECRFVGLSGTITRRSLKDYQHLSELALRKHSPLPVHWRDLEDWAMALDVTKKDPMPPGALLKFCTEEEIAKVQSTPMPKDAQVFVRQAFRRRLIETPGVVATRESALGTSLVITGLYPLVPAEVQLVLDHLHERWEIDDDELVDAIQVYRYAAQLAAGFHYRWVWPDGKKDFEWLDARKAWNKEVRDILKLSKRGLDSPMLIANAVKRGEFKSGTWAAWAAVKDRYNPEPPREAVWHNKFLVHEACRWGISTCSSGQPGIIWYLHDVLGREIAKDGGYPFFGPGMDAAQELARVNAKKTPVIVCSLRAHGTGKNLQQFSRNLFTTPPAGGVEWEQTMARTHRPGQEADEVDVDVYLHTGDLKAAFWSAIRDAKYIEQTQGQRQKLLYARKVFNE